MKLKTLVCLSLITLVVSFGPPARAQTFSVIHTFQSGIDGSAPEAGLTLKNGIFYGTTFGGGFFGTVYQMSHVGSNWVTTPISFLYSGLGSGPLPRVVFGPDGHLYGTQGSGGSCSGGTGGLAFELIPPFSICKTAACFWKEGVLWQFGCGSDGVNPGYGDLVWDQNGNFYGTTYSGGDFDLGTVYQMKPSGGNGWTESVIWNFEGQPDGATPYSGLIFDGKNNFYGTTSSGGLYNFGAVFKLTYDVNLGWTQQVIYDFQGGGDGMLPIGGLILDSVGTNLYGTTSDGGSGGGGTIFELSPSGDTWTFRLLYSFSGTPGRACGPRGTLTMDTAGNLYGTTYGSPPNPIYNCGANNFGNVFKLTKVENSWVYSSLHDFTGGDDGAAPISNVTFDTSGNLYGTASTGGYLLYPCAGPPGCGVVWMIAP
jgi:uncharacterized repeat protein (TIGR03803 family)